MSQPRAAGRGESLSAVAQRSYNQESRLVSRTETPAASRLFCATLYFFDPSALFLFSFRLTPFIVPLSSLKTALKTHVSKA